MSVSVELRLEAINVGKRLRPLSETAVGQLMESMNSIGLQVPILVWNPTGSPKLVAGLHRLEAARRLGLETIACQHLTLNTEDDAERVEIAENLHRADLTPMERAEQTARWIELTEIISSQVGTKLGRPQGGTRAASRELGISNSGAHRAQKIAAIDPEAKEIAAGLPQQDLLEIAAKEKKKQAEFARFKIEERKRKTAEKKANRVAKEQALASKISALPTKSYGVILADPPWRFEPWSRESGMDRAADNHYPTLDLAAILATRPPAADDAVLLLWATVPMLREALQVMAGWNFAYKSNFAWVKLTAGMGYWNRNAHEHLLIGTRGHIPAPAPGDQASSVIMSPAGAHSSKPQAAYEIAERYFPTLPKFEMFARSRRDGWDSWGAEAPNDEEAAA